MKIVISSCDKYSHVWPILTQVFIKYWPNCPYPIYFITNEMDAPFGETIKTGKDKGWSNQMIKALDQIDSDIFLFLLEDYWFTETVHQRNLERLLNVMHGYDVDHVRLYVSEGSKKIPRTPFLYRTDVLRPDEDYRASLNAGIWRTKTMKELITPDASIWESEHIMTERSRDKMFLTVQEMNCVKYDIDHNMIEKNKLTKYGRAYIEKEGFKYE